MDNITINITEQPIEATINVQPQPINVEITIEQGGGGGGGAVDSVNGQTGIVVLDANDVGADVAGAAAAAEAAANAYTDAEIAALPPIPAAQVNSDWNAVSGVAEILNKPTIPAAQIQSDWNQSNNAAVDFIKNKPTIIPGIPKGTASGTDTYTATISGVTAYTNGDAYLIRFPNGNTSAATLNINSIGARSLYRNNDGALIGGDVWAGAEMLVIFNSTLNGFQCIGTSPNSLFSYVTNAESVTINKGQPVYVFGGTGDRITVKLAYNTSDATSAQTIGIAVANISAGQKGIIIIQGQLDNLSIFPTSTWSDGDFVYLGATAGSVTNVKPYAPNHLVYLGYVTSASNGNAGRMYVKVQNGYELDELHNVSAQNPNPNDGLFYNSVTGLWTARAGTKSDVGLSNVDNTSDANKPISSATQTALNAKEDTITTLPISKGGTNSGTALNNNRIITSSGGAIGEAAAITALRALKSDANGIPTHFDTTTEPSLTELSYVKGVTSAIQTQLAAKQNLITIFNDGAPTTANTGNTTSNLVKSILIPANTFSNNTTLLFRCMVTKTGVAGQVTCRMFIHTSAAVGGTQISTSQLTIAGGGIFVVERTLSILVAAGTGNGTRHAPPTSNLTPEFNALTTGYALNTAAINWTVDQYINLFLQNGAAGDSTFVQAVYINKY